MLEIGDYKLVNNSFSVTNTIAENTIPHSEKPISSRVRVRSVLELAAGTVSRLGIEVGDQVQHVMFEP